MMLTPYDVQETFVSFLISTRKYRRADGTGVDDPELREKCARAEFAQHLIPEIKRLMVPADGLPSAFLKIASDAYDALLKRIPDESQTFSVRTATKWLALVHAAAFAKAAFERAKVKIIESEPDFGAVVREEMNLKAR